MNRISKNVAIILRAERMMTRRRMAVMAHQTGLMIFAGLVGALGLIMLNVAAFYALSDSQSPQIAAVIVSLADMILAIVLVFAASRVSADKELEPVAQLRDLAIEDLECDLESTLAEAKELTSNVRRLAKDPLGAVLPSVIMPLLASLIRSLKK